MQRSRKKDRHRRKRFVFTLEAVGDVDSGALTGLTVGDTENEAALLAAFEHGLMTTGAPPLALTLDNKPSNQTPAVEAGIQPAELLAATPGRGQAKAPLEGTFGLFSQNAPPLSLTGKTRRELARSILFLVVLTWAWARNGRPRRGLAGRSAAEHYQAAQPTADEVAAAKEWIAELRRKRRRAIATQERRADPARKALLDEAFARLGIPDPEGRLARDLAHFSTEALLRALAVFQAKRDLGTLPKDADPARYLAGIVRNTDDRLEIEATARNLLELRLRHHQLSLAPLERELEAIAGATSPEELPKTLLARALKAEPLVDFRFFARATAKALTALGSSRARELLPHLVRRVAAHFEAPKHRRHDLVAALTQAALDEQTT